MERGYFEALCISHRESLEQIRSMAHQIHESVNQFYDGDKPYGYHLDMVAKEVYAYGHLVLVGEADLLPLFMGAWFHDSIEDARVSYNDVKKIALKLGLTEEQAFMASEIVYALTNEKGRNRKERAGKRYYEGIRNTPYAPFVKMCDRMANIRYSCGSYNMGNLRMAKVYEDEMPYFTRAITVETDDIRFSVPETMVDDAWGVMAKG
jgi:(p)ppGpp synthase/HD superfamily hydrolase